MSDIEQLVTSLQNEDPNKRYEACQLLRAAPPPLPPEAINALRIATNDKHPKVSEAAQRALAAHTSDNRKDVHTMKGKFQSVRFLSALIFTFASTICIMAGWYIGTNLGRFNPELWVDTNFMPFVTDASSQAAGQGGVSGGLWGLVIGSFLGFGGLGLVTAWTWRRKYPNIELRHSLLLVLGWMFVPVVILVLVLWSPF